MPVKQPLTYRGINLDIDKVDKWLSDYLGRPLSLEEVLYLLQDTNPPGLEAAIAAMHLSFKPVSGAVEEIELIEPEEPGPQVA